MHPDKAGDAELLTPYGVILPEEEISLLSVPQATPSPPPVALPSLPIPVRN